MDIIIAFIFTLFFLGIGLTFGKIGERRHYQSIKQREEQYRHILLFSEKLPPSTVAGQPFYIVSGSMVISGDYFKQFLGGLKMFFGGRITSFESMLDRGRREAILRMKEQAAKQGANTIFNVQFATTALGNSGQNGKLTSTEILVYGTAWKASSF